MNKRIKDIIDVTQCPYYKEDNICTYLPFKSKCEGDCNWTSYKEMEEKFNQAEQTVVECHKYMAELEDKLEDKEQECEELKGDLYITEENLKDYTEHYNKASEELDKLKAERDGYIDKYLLESQKVAKLSKVLKEIKEIVEKAQWDYRMPKEVWDLILQKISEVIDD